jgi:hypothetical protein
MTYEDYVWGAAGRGALVLAVLHLLVPILLGYLGLTVAFFRRRELAPGILCAVFAVFCPGLPVGVLVALAFGWLHARRWGTRPFMALWTVLLALVCLDWVVLVAYPDLAGVILLRLFGGR